jgi:hypothetical protein
MKNNGTFRKTYIPDEKVKALRDAGITNFSKFVRERVDEYLEARAGSPNTSPELPPVKEANNT